MKIVDAQALKPKTYAIQAEPGTVVRLKSNGKLYLVADMAVPQTRVYGGEWRRAYRRKLLVDLATGVTIGLRPIDPLDYECTLVSAEIRVPASPTLECWGWDTAGEQKPFQPLRYAK
jgi:hypothetical protein